MTDKHHDPILPTIEAYIAEHGISATMFGIRAAHDPMLVFRLRKGREMKHAIRKRIIHFMLNQPTPEGNSDH